MDLENTEFFSRLCTDASRPASTRTTLQPGDELVIRWKVDIKIEILRGGRNLLIVRTSVQTQLSIPMFQQPNQSREHSRVVVRGIVAIIALVSGVAFEYVSENASPANRFMSQGMAANETLEWRFIVNVPPVDPTEEE